MNIKKFTTKHEQVHQKKENHLVGNTRVVERSPILKQEVKVWQKAGLETYSGVEWEKG